VISVGLGATFDIEVYPDGTGEWAQAKFLVHGYDDVLWTDDIDQAVAFLKESALRMFPPDAPPNDSIKKGC
jgi:hypothetical protein